MADFSSLLGIAGVGGGIGKAIVQLELDTAKYQAELKTAQAQTTAGANGMSSSLAAFGGVAKTGMLLAGAAVVGFGVNAVRAASDLGEAVNKSNVIFGSNAREIEAWAETGATAFGLAKTEALDAAASFGQILQNASLSVGASADMSKALVQLAGDMASFNNEDPTEMLERLRSGLAGEVEPLRRFGVDLSEAATQAKAMELGLGGANDELTQAEKIQARYALILEDTNKQQGDFARTAESLPNQIRSMRAEFENTSAEVGEALLPAATALLGVLRDLIPAITFVAEALGKLVENAEALAGPFGIFIDRVSQGVKPTEEMNRLIERQVLEFQAYKESVAEGSKGIQRFAEEVDKAAKNTHHFADMTGEDFEEWEQEVTSSMREAVLSLDDLKDASDVTGKQFIRSQREMLQDARVLAKAMREISAEKWVNENYIKFLVEQGPSAIVGFADTNERQQRRLVEQWEEGTRGFERSIGKSFKDLEGALDGLDRKTTNHTVKVKYEYVGFDPSKPGMGGSQQER